LTIASAFLTPDHRRLIYSMTVIDNALPSTTDATPDAGAAIVNDGFFIDIDMLAMRDPMRLDGTVTDARLRPAIVSAMLSVNRDLRKWQEAQLTKGFTRLGDVPATMIDDESRLVSLYRRAVYSTAKADLIERYRDYDTTAAALSDKKSMEWMDIAPSDQRRNAHWRLPTSSVGRA